MTARDRSPPVSANGVLVTWRRRGRTRRSRHPSTSRARRGAPRSSRRPTQRCPPEISTRSTPSESSIPTTWAESSTSKPPGWKSLALIFTNTANPGSTWARMRRTISSRNRDRLARLPAPLVGAQVGGRGQELPDQVAMRGVDLDAVEAGLFQHPGGGGEPVDQVGDLGAGQGSGGSEDAAAPYRGQGAGGQRMSVIQDGGHSTLVHQLADEPYVAPVHGRRPFGQRRGVGLARRG